MAAKMLVKIPYGTYKVPAVDGKKYELSFPLCTKTKNTGLQPQVIENPGSALVTVNPFGGVDYVNGTLLQPLVLPDKDASPWWLYAKYVLVGKAEWQHARRARARRRAGRARRFADRSLRVCRRHELLRRHDRAREDVR
jgi:hypothetical protein